MMRYEARFPKCLRCGRVVPHRRRATSDYCTDKCARDQQHDDEASAASERAVQEEPPRYEVLLRRTVHQWITLDVSAPTELAARRRALKAARQGDTEAPDIEWPENGWGWDKAVSKPVIVALSGDES